MVLAEENLLRFEGLELYALYFSFISVERDETMYDLYFDLI